jgi:hypothetical protein
LEKKLKLKDVITSSICTIVDRTCYIFSGKIVPFNCEILLGQDWRERFGNQFQIPLLNITLPIYSETIVLIPTNEQGKRLVDTQEVQESTFCSSSVVNAKILHFFV